jgi:quinol-cytochrome oxidoreductase complex cytochrome b subunit
VASTDNKFNLKIVQPVYDWLNDRVPLTEAIKFAGKKEVPVHKHSIWYYMGGIAALFMGIQFVTGFLLMFHYVPSFEGAYASVQAINSEVPFGWLIRSMHSWGANVFILVLFVHMFSTYFMKAYRAPREFTWLSGLGLVGLAMAFGFTGYMLPMDMIAYFATKVGVDVAGSAPFVGGFVADFVRGGGDIGQATMNRFFSLHVIAFPILMLGLMGLHMTLIQLQGISEPESIKKLPASERKYEKFFPDFIIKDVFVWFAVIVGFMLLVTLSPWHLGPAADPAAAAPEGIKPEWYFWSQFQALKLFPPHILFFEGEHVAMAVIGAAFASLAIVPILDSTGKYPFISKFATVYGVIFLIAWIILTIWGGI